MVQKLSRFVYDKASGNDCAWLRFLFSPHSSSREKSGVNEVVKVGERPFGYTVLDLHAASDDRRRVFSHLLMHEG